MLASLIHPDVVAVVVVAIALNMLHRVVATMVPLYGVEIGLGLTQVGIIMGSYALCNAVVRPASGVIVQRFGHKAVSYAGLLLQVAAVMLFPLFGTTATLVAVAVIAAAFRGIVMVGNTVAMVEDMPEQRFSRGVASGVFNSANDLGHILGPGFAGFMASVSSVSQTFVLAPLILAVVFILSLAASATLLRRQPEVEDKRQ